MGKYDHDNDKTHLLQIAASGAACWACLLEVSTVGIGKA